MHETNSTNLTIALGGILIIAGVVHVFIKNLTVTIDKSGRVNAKLDPAKWSFRSIFPGFSMIAVGAFLAAVTSIVGHR